MYQSVRSAFESTAALFGLSVLFFSSVLFLLCRVIISFCDDQETMLRGLRIPPCIECPFGTSVGRRWLRGCRPGWQQWREVGKPAAPEAVTPLKTRNSLSVSQRSAAPNPQTAAPGADAVPATQTFFVGKAVAPSTQAAKAWVRPPPPTAKTAVTSQAPDVRRYTCTVCKVTIQGTRNWELHQESRHHRAKGAQHRASATAPRRVAPQ